MSMLLPLLAGYMGGRAKKKMMEAEEARNKPLNELKKKELELKLLREKAAYEQQQRKSKLFNLLADKIGFGQQQGALAPQGPPPSDPPMRTTEQSGFNQSVAKAGLIDSLLQKDPLMASFIQKELGVPAFDAMKYNQTQARDDRIGRQGDKRISISEAGLNQRGSEYIAEEITDSEGNVRRVYRKKYGEPPSLTPGQPSGGVVKPPPTKMVEYEEGGVTYIQPVNTRTNQPLAPPRKIKNLPGMNADAAGKTGMLASGLADLEKVKEMLLTPGGDVKDDAYTLLAQAAVPGGGLPWSKGRELNPLILNMLEGKVRIESGAAVPKEEVVRASYRFRPSVLDTKEAIKSKLARMESYLRGTISLLDPSKKYSAQALILAGKDGKQYVWQPAKNTEKQFAPKKAEAEEYLIRNNSEYLRKAFKKKYGYLPDGVK